MLPFCGIVRYHMADVNCAARELLPPGARPGLGIVSFKRCRLVFSLSLPKHMRFVSTKSAGV